MQIKIKADIEHGLIPISPSEPAFDEWITPFISKDSDLRRLVDAAKPISLLMKNDSDNDIVGCSLTWEFLKTDGTTTTQGHSYSTPGALMGLKVKDPSLEKISRLIPAHSVAFLSLDPLVKQYVDTSINDPRGSTAISGKSREFVRDYVEKLRGQYNNLSRTVVKIDVSVDGTMFADGSFIGPDHNKLLTYFNARIGAERDFLLMLQRERKRNKSAAEILNSVEQIAMKPRVALAQNPSNEEYYAYIYDRFHRSIANELLSARQSKGNDTALDEAKGRLDKPWPTIHKKL